jgi:excisionase family DNA binding protein
MAGPRPSRPPLTFDDGYLRIRELARYSGISVRVLRDYLHDPINPLPHYRVGHLTLVRRSEYDTWAQAFKVAATPTDVDAIVDAMVRR